ncbi:hypothetical protein L7F22_067252 [Adiantum nelumboides]|nr:hypothetical protein [Adiantum nelumboides]
MRRALSGYASLSDRNSIDECWRGDSNWADNRMKLADCGIGFGGKASGGKGGEYYVVTDPSDDPVNPVQGTLRYGVTRMTPLWIYFAHDMTIELENELIITSDKTIDGRGANVHIAHGPCFTIQYVSNVIVHGLNIHHCTPGKAGMVMSSTAHTGYRQGSDGDGISIFGSRNIWVDHNALSACSDGLVDAIHGSTAITISNNVFTDHDKVMLLGHDDGYTEDKGMRVTVAFNRFGPGLVQRMPRCRLGYFHIVNNDFQDWSMYALGGSADPTIISEGNRFLAASAKEVTKRDCNGGWDGWTWKSIDDIFLNGAYFVESGPMIDKENRYGLGVSSKYAQYMTNDVGPLACAEGSSC